MAELREFCKLASENGGLHLNGTSRIFAVVKLPPDEDDYPTEIADQLRYHFFEMDAKTKRPVGFRSDIQPRDERYWTKIDELAFDLKKLLKDIGRLPQRVPAGKNRFDETIPKKIIYLAETTADLAEERRQIKEELKLHNYNVLPDEPLPYVFDQYRKAVTDNLAEAVASINLVGRTYGIIPEGAGERSILRLQLDLVNEFANSRPGFKRLVWMPEKWEPSDDKTRQIFEELKLRTDPQKNFEFLQTSLEEFKTLMHSRLAVNLNGHQAKSIAAAPGRLKVYFVCDRRDLADAKPLISYLRKEKGYEVETPEFEEVEGETPLDVLHQQKLLECDGVIVYWGHGNSRWATSKKADLERVAGVEKTEVTTRMRPLRAKVFYVAQPIDDLKDLFEPSIAPVIKSSGD